MEKILNALSERVQTIDLVTPIDYFDRLDQVALAFQMQPEIAFLHPFVGRYVAFGTRRCQPSERHDNARNNSVMPKAL